VTRASNIVRDEAVRALEVIRDYTAPHVAANYRADDRDGCLDSVHAEATRAIDYIAQVEAAAAAGSILGAPIVG
jgi:hypothetical protein